MAKVSDRSSYTKLTPKKILQILPTELAQMKAGKTTKNLLAEIRNITYS